LLVDAVTFTVGVATLSMVRIPQPEVSAVPDRKGILREAAIGWRYVHARPGLLGLLAIYGWNNFIFSIACVLIAPLLLSFADPVRLGVQYAVGGVGLLLGGVAMATWGGPRKRIHGVLAFSVLGGLFLAAHGLRPSFMLITVAGFVLFLTMPVISASSNSLWQSKVPAQLQGRCFAMQRLLFNLVTVLGYCLAGPLSQRIFEPLLTQGGALAGSIGLVIGVGTGRGIALAFMALGMLMTLAAMAAYSVAAVRLIDKMPDAFFFPGEAITPTAGRQSVAVKA
jgi:hypothetical protein